MLSVAIPNAAIPQEHCKTEWGFTLPSVPSEEPTSDSPESPRSVGSCAGDSTAFSLHSVVMGIARTRVFVDSPDLSKRLSVLRGKRIAIEGGIGAGKTTLGRAVGSYLRANKIDAEFLEESVNNAMLSLFYNDPAKYAYAMQVRMLSKCQEIYRVGNEKVRSGTCVLLDRTLQGNACFEALHLKNGNVSQREHSTYLSMLDEEGPYDFDHVVFLHCTPEEAKRRNELRGRSAESEIPLSYFEDLDKVYVMHFVAQIVSGQKNIVIIDHERFVSHEKIVDCVIANDSLPPVSYSGDFSWLERSTSAQRRALIKILCSKRCFDADRDLDLV